MWNYRLAKLELLALKWAVTEKFRDYLLGSHFTAYTENNPLAYVKESRLGVAEIRWLSKLVLFDFDIKYRMGKSNQAADTLSPHPKSSTDISNDRKSEEVHETISYEIVNDDLSDVIDGIKIPKEIKMKFKETSMRSQKKIMMTSKR